MFQLIPNAFFLENRHSVLLVCGHSLPGSAHRRWWRAGPDADLKVLQQEVLPHIEKRPAPVFAQSVLGSATQADALLRSYLPGALVGGVGVSAFLGWVGGWWVPGPSGPNFRLTSAYFTSLARISLFFGQKTHFVYFAYV